MNEAEEQGAATISRIADSAREYKPAGIWPVVLEKFLALEIPPREYVVDQIIPEQGLALLYSRAGVGKTNFALGLAYAVGSGGSFLRWIAPKPRRVLYIDGEMPAVVMQQRLASTVAGAGSPLPSPDYFHLLTPDCLGMPIPNLSEQTNQIELDALLERLKIEFLVLDNLSTLCNVPNENDAESWVVMQPWALSLRRRRITTLFVHHAGKGGSQRGTSKREDVIDTTIVLKRPGDYRATEGARFEVHLEKARGTHGEPAQPFEAKLETHDGVAMWSIRGLEDADLARAAALFNDGYSVSEAAEDLKISRARAGRLRKKASEKGLLQEPE